MRLLTSTGQAPGVDIRVTGRGLHPWDFPGLELAAAVDSVDAEWLVTALDHRWVEVPRTVDATIASFVPEGYGAYARIFHPVPRTSAAVVSVHGEPPAPRRWSDVARAAGQRLISTSRFASIAGVRREDLNIAEPGPELPKEMLGRLASTLSRFTSTTGLCTFALWDGYGDLSVTDSADLVRFEMPGRTYVLYRGPVAQATAFATQGMPHAPTLWWPADRAWFVGSDVDLDSTYIGGSPEVIRDLLKDHELETLATTPDHAAAGED